MEKTLSQGEIDALFRAAHQAPEEAASPTSAPVKPWNLHEAGVLRKEQLQALSQLHEQFARNLSGALSSYLREKVEVTLVAVEQLAYRDYLTRNPEVTYYGSVRLPPSEFRGILQMDSAIVFPIVDLLLGGQGTVQQLSREVSTIEATILEGVCQIACQELESVWRAMDFRVVFGGTLAAGQMSRVLPAQEKTLSLGFDMAVAEARGMLTIVLPAVVSSSVLRKLATELVYQGGTGSTAHEERIRKRLLECVYDLDFSTRVMKVGLLDLLAIRPGTVLPLRERADGPAVLRTKDQELWLAAPVSSDGSRRAAELLQLVKHEP